MAGHAAKKSKKASEQQAAFYQPFILGINVVYVLFRVIWGWSSMTSWHWAGFALTSLAYYVSYGGLIANAGPASTSSVSKSGTSSSSSYYFDLFGLTVAVQVVTLFSDWGWAIYLLIPAYGLYHAGKWLINW
eukprot:CAMPEP_0113941744 /NCGR_PEP_ID=MMETSP1339-20121228/7598_1 /TAXON_ID=94617 /ORGANISM="Fibrocapsa japonica" /LENGTH=131 /DNA_ID=CAMNT_0000945975 /DNA_START=36 /DNA_END=428 /DNA_ORIENTATION=- /assembly_acc=CAM_ASM_000762